MNNFLVGQKLINQKEFGKALEFFLNFKKEKIRCDEIFFYLGLIYFELNNPVKSIYNLNKFLKKKPNSIQALYNLAFVKQSLGQVDAAKSIYFRLLELDKNKIRPYYGLYTLDQNFLDEDKIEKILNIKKNFKNNLFDQGIMEYLLSKIEKKNKNYLKEIEYLNNSHQFIFESKKQYNISSQYYFNEIISKFYDKLKFINEDKERKINTQISPIFIIGLPRSGSTLVEAILGSASKNIKTIGECHVVNMAVLDQIAPIIYKRDFKIDQFSFEIDIKKLQETSIRKYKQFVFDDELNDQIVIDKSLENFFNIEAIIKIFPNAKFLHTHRNYKDSIIAIYQSLLAELSWTHSIKDIITYVDNYIKILNFYKNKFSNSIMDIDLERFTENSETISKELFDFCGLSWESKALKFYERKDLHSKTLSFSQIRNKVFSYNSKKYHPYYNLLNVYKKEFKFLNKF